MNRNHWEPSSAIFVIACLLGVTYIITGSVHIDELPRAIWKFSCVGTLALYAGWSARTLDGWLLAAALLLSALSDILLDLAGQLPGGISFIIADAFAIALYVRNRKPKMHAGSWFAALAFVVGCAVMAYFLPADRDAALGIAVFVLPLAAMTATGWMSRFSLRLVGIGTAMILSSDMMIFARMGPLHTLPLMNQIIWLSYFTGEAMVTFGVTRKLGHDAPRIFGSTAH